MSAEGASDLSGREIVPDTTCFSIDFICRALRPPSIDHAAYPTASLFHCIGFHVEIAWHRRWEGWVFIACSTASFTFPSSASLSTARLLSGHRCRCEAGNQFFCQSQIFPPMYAVSSTLRDDVANTLTRGFPVLHWESP